jgi:hypothetical protein
MPARRRTEIVAAAIATAVALAGCSDTPRTGGASASTVVEQAVTNLGRQSSIGMTFSVPITEAQARQIEAKSGGASLSPAGAKALTTGTVFVSETTGHGEAMDSSESRTDSADSYDVAMTIGSERPIEIRYVDQNLYARVDIAQLLGAVGQSSAPAASVEHELAQLDELVPGLSDLGQGKWVQVSHASLESLLSLLKQATGGNSLPSGAQIKSLRSQLLTILLTNTTFTTVGSSGGSTEYSATLQVHQLVTQIGPVVQRYISFLPGAGSTFSSGLSKLGGDIPAGQTAVVDLFVSGSHLQQAQLDLNQFAGKSKVGFPVPLRVSFTAPAPPAVPSGATPLDLSKLPAQLQQMMAGVTRAL